MKTILKSASIKVGRSPSVCSVKDRLKARRMVLSDMVMATAYADIWSRPSLDLRAHFDNMYCASCSRA